MAQENNIAQQLNDLLVTRNFHPDMRDSQGKVCDSSDAKVFTFDYVSGAGKNYGTMVIILDSGNDLKAMFGNNLGRGMEDADKDEWYKFQQQLSQFANSHRWTYTGDDISKLKYTMQGLAAIKEGLFEGYYGTRRISYAGEPTQARLMIRHNRKLGENDARFRYVESIFVETADGERHRLPFTNLAGGRAMLEHVRQGGKPYDVRGNHICEMITELKVLARFNRASQGRVVEGVKQSVVQGAQTYYKSLRENIKRLSSPRGYGAYFESWHPADITEQDQLVEDIKTLFVEQTIDDRIEQALPLLAKIQQGREMKEAEIFENWVNNVTEGTWSLPETPEQMTRLKELMSGELIVGPDGTNATEQLYDLIGDDALFDRISELAAQDPRANLWDDTDVQARMQELGIQMPDDSAPDMAAQPQPQQGQQGMSEADNIAAFESLQRMRHLSGMKLKENVLNDAGSTLAYIMTSYQRDVKDFAQTGEMSSDLYDALYDYYFDDMPYGVKKARSGDPYEWIGDRFAEDILSNAPVDENLGGVVRETIPAAPLTETQCNSTMEGHFCPVHGLSECWSQGMYEDILSTGIQLAEDDDTKARAKAALDDLDKPDTELKTSSDDAMRARAKNQKGTKLTDMNPIDQDQWKKEVDQLQKQKSTNEGLRDAVAKRVMSKMDNLRTVSKYPDAGVQQAGTMTPSLAGKVVSDYEQPLFKSRGPSTPYTPAEQQTVQGVRKQMQSQADKQSNLDYDGPRGSSAAPSPQATRAARSQGAAFDAQNNMQSNQDLFNRAYGIDEASMMNPEIPSDFGSDQHLRDLMKLAGAYRAGDRSSLQKSTNDLLARMTGQDKSSASAVAPSFGTPGAAHDGQGGSDYQDEEPNQSDAETARLARSGTPDMPNDRKMNDADYINSLNLDMPKGQAHDGQGGSDYSNDPDQSDAETSRLNRASNSVDLGLPPGQLDKDAWDDMMKTVPALDKDAWDNLVRGKVSEADAPGKMQYRAKGFTELPMQHMGGGYKNNGSYSPDKPVSPVKTPSFDVTKDPLFRAAMNRIDADNKAKSQMGSTVTTVPLSDLESIEPPRLSMVPTVDVTSTFESREGDALLARIKSLALIR